MRSIDSWVLKQIPLRMIFFIHESDIFFILLFCLFYHIFVMMVITYYSMYVASHWTIRILECCVAYEIMENRKRRCSETFPFYQLPSWLTWKYKMWSTSFQNMYMHTRCDILHNGAINIYEITIMFASKIKVTLIK